MTAQLQQDIANFLKQRVPYSSTLRVDALLIFDIDKLPHPLVIKVHELWSYLSPTTDVTPLTEAGQNFPFSPTPTAASEGKDTPQATDHNEVTKPFDALSIDCGNHVSSADTDLATEPQVSDSKDDNNNAPSATKLIVNEQPESSPSESESASARKDEDEESLGPVGGMIEEISDLDEEETSQKQQHARKRKSASTAGPKSKKRKAFGKSAKSSSTPIVTPLLPSPRTKKAVLQEPTTESFTPPSVPNRSPAPKTRKASGDAAKGLKVSNTTRKTPLPPGPKSKKEALLKMSVADCSTPTSKATKGPAKSEEKSASSEKAGARKVFKREAHVPNNKIGHGNAKLKVRLPNTPVLVLPFHCPWCNRSFQTQVGLTQHKRIVHKPKLLTCGTCGEMGFETFALLKKHRRVYHPKSDDSQLDLPKHELCIYCTETFEDKEALALHQSIHISIRVVRLPDPVEKEKQDSKASPKPESKQLANAIMLKEEEVDLTNDIGQDVFDDEQGTENEVFVSDLPDLFPDLDC